MIKLGNKPVSRFMVRFQPRGLEWVPKEIRERGLRFTDDCAVSVVSDHPIGDQNELVNLVNLPSILQKHDYGLVWFFHNISGEQKHLVGFDFVYGTSESENSCLKCNHR